jgi:hypothetical protein
MAVGVDEVGELLLRPAVHHVRGRLLLPPVHAHVQGTVGLEAEAALRLVELDRRDAQVQEHAVRPLATQPLGDLAEVAGLETDAGTVLVEDAAGPLQRLGVAVEAQEPAVGGAGAQEGPRVAPQSHGPVHPETPRPHCEELQRLVEENADVTRIRSHTPPGASRPRR